MSKLGDALGFASPKGLKGAETPAMDEGDGSDTDSLTPASEKTEPKGGTAEILAMRQFDRATTPEAKVQALKDFGEACGWGGGDSGAY